MGEQTSRLINILLAIEAGKPYSIATRQDRQNLYRLLDLGLVGLTLTPAGQANVDAITPRMARRAIITDETQELEAVT